MKTLEDLLSKIGRIRQEHVPASVKQWSRRKRVWYQVSRHYGSNDQVAIAYGQVSYCSKCGIDTAWPCMVIKTVDYIEK